MKADQTTRSGGIHISHSPGYPVSARYVAFRIGESDVPEEDIAIAYVPPGSIPDVNAPGICLCLVAPERDRLQGIAVDLQSAEHLALRLMRAICDVKQKLNQEAFEEAAIAHALSRVAKP